MHEYGISKPVEIILRMERGKRENSRGNEPHWGRLNAYM
jgi:hypothetical protein